MNPGPARPGPGPGDRLWEVLVRAAESEAEARTLFDDGAVAMRELLQRKLGLDLDPLTTPELLALMAGETPDSGLACLKKAMERSDRVRFGVTRPGPEEVLAFRRDLRGWLDETGNGSASPGRRVTHG